MTKIRILRDRQPAQSQPASARAVGSYQDDPGSWPGRASDTPEIEMWRRPDRLRIAKPIKIKDDPATRRRGFTRGQLIADCNAVGRYR